MIKVIVTSAVALSASQKDTLQKALAKKYPEKIELQEIVDPTVLGGLRLRIGSQEYDSTLRAKLNQVRQVLLAQV